MKSFDVVIVGAGMAGIYSLYKMKQLGLSVRLLEAGGGVGGTWYWNNYPGARVDVESLDYSYSFSEELQREFRWSEIFAAQPELLSYFDHVVDRFDLRDDIQLNSTVERAIYDDKSARWTISTADERFSTRYVIMATGLLSVPLKPKFPELEDFHGEVYMTGSWPHEPVDLAGKRVGVFGNGSSGMQVVPTVAQQAAHLTLFQRTAAYAVPVRNGPIDDREYETALESYETRRSDTRGSVVGTFWSAYETSEVSVFEVSPAEREAEFEDRWQRGGAGFVVAFNDLLTDMPANKVASDWLRAKIRSLVKDPTTAELLVPPDDLPVGCKRLCVENGFFDAFNRPNVTLVDLTREPIATFEAGGLRTEHGHYPLDVVIMATGFDAFSGALLKMDVRGRSDGSLADHWAEGPRNYLGMVMKGFPNLFTINGPGCVAANFFLASEVQVDWLARLITHADRHGIDAIEASDEAEAEWMEHINTVAEMVTVTNHCQSWFRGTNVPGKPVAVMNYLGGLGAYSSHCEVAEREGYPGLGFKTSAGPTI